MIQPRETTVSHVAFSMGKMYRTFTSGTKSAQNNFIIIIIMFIIITIQPSSLAAGVLTLTTLLHKLLTLSAL